MIMRIIAALGLSVGFGGAFAQEEPEAAPALAEELIAVAPTAFLNETVSAPISTVCPFRGEIDYEPGEVSCGFIEVPENREDPESRTIRLLYVKIAAKASLPDADEDTGVYREDPIVYLTGGPGASVRSYVPRFLEHDVVKTRDLYVLQQRGIAESGPICAFFSRLRPELKLAESVLETELEEAARIKECVTSAKARGIDVTAYNTPENARDVKALREALGFESWNVWGISYGSHLGQMLTQVDPEGIRGLVIDAIVPNDLVDLMRINRWLNRDLEMIFQRCSEQKNKHCRDLEDRMEAALRSPRLTVEAADKELLPKGTASFGGELPALAAFIMLYEQDQHPAIPAVMDRLLTVIETGDAEALRALTALDLFGGSAQGMSTLIRCNDGYYQASAEETPDDLAENLRVAGAMTTAEGSAALARACVEAGVGPRDREDYRLVKTDVPTLIVNGAWDPITPPPLARRILPGFANGRLIEVPYAGHGPTRSMSKCAGEVMTAFFDDPSQDLSALDASCLEEGVAPPIFADYLVSESPLELAGVLAAGERKTLIGPAALAGGSIFALLGGFLMIPAGFLARRVAGHRSSELAAGPFSLRVLAFGTAAASVSGLGLLAAGAAAAEEISPISLMAGFADPAGIGALLLLVGGLLGLALAGLTIKARLGEPLRAGTLLGFLLMGLGAMSLSVLALRFDLLPF
ncbi:MAG: alpha/beta fold hydrolase [Parvularcula sp.]|jgi:pimeloyl-ACP methyl ester carboxylesterase|nr:alpha/beta fold hydrolase [Parvularcula sp.]